MKTFIFAGLCSILLSIIAAIFVIPLLKKLKAGQTVLSYVKTHKQKNGTPTMGGLFFIIPSVIVYFVFCGFSGNMANVAVAIGLAFLIVGFIDDFIKVHFKKNEGLKAYQKIIFQFAIAIVSGVFCYLNGVTVFYLPFVKKSIDLGVLTVPFMVITEP